MIFSHSPATPPSDETSAEITKLRDALTESFKKGDVDRLVAYLDPDVIVTWQNGEICKGREEVKAFYHRMMTGEKRIVREVKSAPEILGRRVYGEFAVSWGNLRDHFILTDGTDLPFNSVFTSTIAKRGDVWLVTGFHASVNAFANPILKTAIAKTFVYAGIVAGAAGLLLGVFAAGFLRRSSK